MDREFVLFIEQDRKDVLHGMYLAFYFSNQGYYSIDCAQWEEKAAHLADISSGTQKQGAGGSL